MSTIRKPTNYYDFNVKNYISYSEMEKYVLDTIPTASSLSKYATKTDVLKEISISKENNFDRYQKDDKILTYTYVIGEDATKEIYTPGISIGLDRTGLEKRYNSSLVAYSKAPESELNGSKMHTSLDVTLVSSSDTDNISSAFNIISKDNVIVTSLSHYKDDTKSASTLLSLTDLHIARGYSVQYGNTSAIDDTKYNLKNSSQELLENGYSNILMSFMKIDNSTESGILINKQTQNNSPRTLLEVNHSSTTEPYIISTDSISRFTGYGVMSGTNILPLISGNSTDIKIGLKDITTNYQTSSDISLNVTDPGTINVYTGTINPLMVDKNGLTTLDINCDDILCGDINCDDVGSSNITNTGLITTNTINVGSDIVISESIEIFTHTNTLTNGDFNVIYNYDTQLNKKFTTSNLGKYTKLISTDYTLGDIPDVLYFGTLSDPDADIGSGSSIVFGDENTKNASIFYETVSDSLNISSNLIKLGNTSTTGDIDVVSNLVLKKNLNVGEPREIIFVDHDVDISSNLGTLWYLLDTSLSTTDPYHINITDGVQGNIIILKNSSSAGNVILDDVNTASEQLGSGEVGTYLCQGTDNWIRLSISTI